SVMTLFFGALMIVLTVGFTVYMRRLSGGIRYELAKEALLIYGSGRPVEVPYSSLETASSESPSGMPFRVMGVSLPGLHWGNYSWKQLGPGLRLYATRLKPLVVIRAGKRTFGLTPQDDKGFVEALQRKIS